MMYVPQRSEDTLKVRERETETETETGTETGTETDREDRGD